MSDNILESTNKDVAAGIILCGGKSSRMGVDKASVEFDGSPLLSRICQRVRTVASPVIVVAAQGQNVPQLPDGVILVRDEYPEEGPLGGLLAGLSSLTKAAPATKFFFVTACDLPFLNPAVLSQMKEMLVSTAPTTVGHVVRAAGRIQPLHSVFQITVFDNVKTVFESGQRSLQSLLNQCELLVSDAEEFRIHDPELTFLLNVNTEADLIAARRQLDSDST